MSYQVISFSFIKCFQGPQPEEKPVTGSSGSVTDAHPSGSDSPASKVSTGKYRNYAVVAGLVTAAAGIGWYVSSRPKETAAVQD
ncbi:hypothetical protein Dimus_019999 [Dionaea muscipula]